MQRATLLSESSWEKLLEWAKATGMRLNPNPAWAGITLARPTQIGGVVLETGTYKPKR